MELDENMLLFDDSEVNPGQQLQYQARNNCYMSKDRWRLGSFVSNGEETRVEIEQLGFRL